jgi:hypothetical protein
LANPLILVFWGVLSCEGFRELAGVAVMGGLAETPLMQRLKVVERGFERLGK